MPKPHRAHTGPSFAVLIALAAGGFATAGCSLLVDSEDLTGLRLPNGQAAASVGSGSSSANPYGAPKSSAPNGSSATGANDGDPADDPGSPSSSDPAPDAGTSPPPQDAGPPPAGSLSCPGDAMHCTDFSTAPSWSSKCEPKVGFGEGVMTATPSSTFSGGCYIDLSTQITTGTIHFEQDVLVTTSGSGMAETGQLVLREPGETEYVGFRFQNGRVRFQTNVLDLGPIPSGWIHLVFDTNLATNQVSGSVNGVPFTTNLPNGSWAVDEIDFAVNYTTGSGWSFKFDNVLVHD